jgi:uncharacterized membrane protein
VSKTRLEAFSDGVIAILITIMVLELRTPHGTTWAALREDLPVLLAYVLSFVLIGIYWNNHHHMLAAVTRISGMTLWANQHLLFWLSLVPVATAWMSENHFPPIPVAAYGVVLLAASLAYSVLQATLLRTEGDRSVLAAAIGTDVKGRASNLMYGLGIGLSFANRWAGIAAYVAVAPCGSYPTAASNARLPDRMKIAAASRLNRRYLPGLPGNALRRQQPSPPIAWSGRTR